MGTNSSHLWRLELIRVCKISDSCNFMIFFKPNVESQIREQMSGPDLYVLTVAFIALKNWFFWKKKFFPTIFFFLPFFYATFQCGRYNVFKFLFFYFFAHKKLKKPPSKVAHNRPKPFLRQSSPGHSPQPRSSFPFYKKPNPNVSLLVSAYYLPLMPY